LLIRVVMAYFDVRHVLIDLGISCDIMYANLFYSFDILENDLLPYNGYDLYGFNEASTTTDGVR